MTEPASPTPPSERIVSLDALRGVALLGILIINVRVFAMPEATLLNPTVYGDFSGANYWVWLLGHVFAQSKFITVFSALFGAGVLLFIDSKREKGQPAVRLQLRRTAILIAIGLLHAYLLWYGDVLVAYGFTGLFLVAVRHLEASQLAKLGVLFLCFVPVVELSTALTVGGDAIAGQWAPAEAALQQEVATYRGGYLEQFNHRVPTSLARQTASFVGATFWRVGGVMLLGMALYRWGVLTGERSQQLYRRLIGGGVLGVGIVLAGVVYIEQNDWSAGAALFWRQFNYWGSLLVAGGYVGVVTLYARRRPNGPITRGFAAVGRTAFTNYLLQTVVATSVFYGHGLGLFGSVSRVETMGFVAAVWIAQIVLSVLWLRKFRFGPVEWLWRTLTYGQRQPLRA
ncbi:MAG: putative membrane protein [uncultured archaeon A07HR60]|nr:MAG: putative membrane protein [uncultured archaeon A07HR60]